MARAANSENIKRDESGPDFNGAVGLVRGQIRTNESDIQSTAQDNSTLYKRIEKQMGVHRGAAKDFAKIDKMAGEKRTDYLRSLLGLLGVAGYNDFDDLVDRAQKPAGKDKGQKTDKPKGKPAPAPDAIDDTAPTEQVDLKTGMVVGADGEDIRQASPEELAAERNRQADFDDTSGNIHPFPGSKAN